MLAEVDANRALAGWRGGRCRVSMPNAEVWVQRHRRAVASWGGMMTRQVVYIAGAYAAPTADGVRRNVQRATALGQLAALEGLAPLVPHALGWCSVYGSQTEEDPSVRTRAVESGESLARAVAVARGELWVILRDDGTASAGVQRECAAFRSACLSSATVVEQTWADWRWRFAAARRPRLWAACVDEAVLA